jgi:hypothetical protein
VFTQQFSLVALSFPPSLLSLVSVCITTAKTFLLVLSVLLGLCLYFSISFDRFPASSMAAHVFGLEILLAPVLAPFSVMLIFLQSSTQLPIFFAVPSFILVLPVSLQSSLQIDFSCGVDSCFRSSVSHRNLLVSSVSGHDAR